MRRRLQPAVPRFDFDDALHVLRDNLGRADAFITALETLAERPSDHGDDDGEDEDGGRRRNHEAYLLEAAKLAVRAAGHAGENLAKRGVS